MSALFLGQPAYLTYAALLASVLCLWIPSRGRVPLWGFCLGLALGFGLYAKILTPLALLAVAAEGASAYFALRYGIGLAKLCLVAISAALMLHLMPGFHNLQVLNAVQVSRMAPPYSLFLNFDKALVGLFILGFGPALIARREDWMRAFSEVASTGLLFILMLGVLALGLGLVHLDAKFPAYGLLWAVSNLLILCVAEEAFYRGLIQRQLRAQLPAWAAIGVSSLVFGLAHYPGGMTYVLLATIAGVGYGWIYEKSGYIEASILTHFALNLTHFLLFTYPVYRLAH
jgi:membrane protease YdiL (CAAX protease family)